MAGASHFPVGSIFSTDAKCRCAPFSEYYQTGGGEQPDETQIEPLKRQRELTAGRMEGSHSPFGFIWQIASQTGWSVRHILWKVPYPTLLMMMIDAPRYVSAEEIKKKVKGKRRKVKGQDPLGFFQTRLNDKK